MRNDQIEIARLTTQELLAVSGGKVPGVGDVNGPSFVSHYPNGGTYAGIRVPKGTLACWETGYTTDEQGHTGYCKFYDENGRPIWQK